MNDLSLEKFFYASKITVFGVADEPTNMAKNVIYNLQEMGFEGDIYPVGRKAGKTFGKSIVTNPESLPDDIDLAVILVPRKGVAETLDICGRKGVRHAVVSTGGFSEFDDEDNQYEKETLHVAKKYGIRLIGPNCLGVYCTDSKVCTAFNPIRPKAYKKGPVSLIIQSGGVTTQCAYTFSDEYIGFSKLISVGNKLDVNEIELMKYLLNDPATEQIHLYLESIEDGQELMRLAKSSPKPIVLLKANLSQIAAPIAKSHTAALYNNDRIVDCSARQAGMIRVQNIHEMTVCAKAFRLPPLKGERLAVISMSGGFSVVLGDVCEKYGFQCPALPQSLIDQIESKRRGGIIRMSNPMDTGDIHELQALEFIIEQCLNLNDIDGAVISFVWDSRLTEIMGSAQITYDLVLAFFQSICDRVKKPISLSFIAERREIDKFKKVNTFPVFNTPEESVQALSFLRTYWEQREASS
ncbi:CoA-binding protein [Thermodesulfobacteriota bacterium]